VCFGETAGEGKLALDSTTLFSQLAIAPGESVSLLVIFRPLFWKSDSGYVEIVSDSSPQPTKVPVTIKIQGMPAFSTFLNSPT
jgi:hypothetical protein